MSTSQEPDSLIGERYRLERSLGSGGMGEVFLASDIFLHKLVALKLLKERLVEDPSIRRRFDQEVRVCAALSSIHIVQVTDCGFTPEGYPFYVMEYLEGKTLGDILVAEGHLAPDRAVRLAIQVCEGLQVAHEGFQYQGRIVSIVHRDLKPENIFIVDSGMGELVKILDFGIAKVCSEIQTGGSLMAQTQQGVFLGTAHYASPEQIRVEPIGIASDIYSLGVMFYEMLSGTDPFGLAAEGNLKMTAWMKAHLGRNPIPLRDQPACRELSAELEKVVMRCLEKSADRRFGSAAELGGILRSTPIFAPTLTLPVPRFTSYRWLWIFLAVTLVGTGIGIAFLVFMPSNTCTFEQDAACFCRQHPNDPKCVI